jgi:hypothetical protein
LAHVRRAAQAQPLCDPRLGRAAAVPDDPRSRSTARVAVGR